VRLHVLFPTYKPVGGVVKLFDYIGHARSIGYDVSVWCPEAADPALPIFQRSAFAGLLDDAGTRFHSQPRVRLSEADLQLVSLPVNFYVAYRRLDPWMSPERIIHIIQNVRHVNPAWHHGIGTRVLTWPAARISINSIVADAIHPWLDRRAFHRVINLGHDVDYFARARTGALSRPLRVAYTTWKSAVGELVEQSLAADREVEFRAIRDFATWDELRDLYHWADVFLATPHLEEGMYLPGLEAMAAGCLVVTPNAGGNMAYCRPDENCLLVGFEAVDQYVEAIRTIRAMSAADISRLRDGGYRITEDFSLARERAEFARYLTDLWDRVTSFERTTTA
jgi:glycosyltransferase involved in cell wall biosynthesis